MSTVFPSQIDGYFSLEVLRDGISSVRADDINRIRGAAIAIEEELGINPSSTYATVRARLDAIEELLLKLYVFEEPGDLVTWDGTDPARFEAGPDGYVLVADSTEPLGLRWSEIDLTPDGYGTVGGTGVANRVAIWNSSANISSDADLTFDGSNLEITGEVRPDGGIRFGDDTVQTTAATGSGGANIALSNLSTTTVNASLFPAIHDGYDVGSDAARWQDGYYTAVHTTNGVRYGDGSIQTTAAVAGGVTSVTGTAPIASSGGPTPAISLNNTAVSPGSYTIASITVDAQGRLTAASTGSIASQLTGFADRALSNLSSPTTVSGSLIPATDDGYDLGTSAKRWNEVFSTTSIVSNYVEVAEVAAPTTPSSGFGRIFAKTNGKLYFLNDGGGEYDLTEVGSGGGGSGGADRNLANLLPTTVNLSLIPATDDGYDLGSASLRWRDLYVGPSSVRFVTTTGETGTARDWRLGVVETVGATQGSFKILEGATQVMTFSPTGQLVPNAGTAAAPSYSVLGSLGAGIYSPGTNQLGFATSGASRATVDDTRWTFNHPFRTSSYIDFVEAAAPVSPGLGFGRLYLDNSTAPSKLIFKDEDGIPHDLTATGGGGAPSGPAGGDLTGTYPNPTLSTSVVSSFARTFLDKTTDAQVRSIIGAGIGNGTVTGVFADGVTMSISGGSSPTPTVAVLAGGIGTTQLANDAVTYAKFQNIDASAAKKILGRFTATSGDMQEMNIGGGLEESGGDLQFKGLSGAITTPGGGSTVTSISANAVTNTHILNGAVTEAKLTFAGGSTLKDATTSAHGLLPTLGGSGEKYLSGLGTWTQPLAAGSAGGDLTGTYPNPTIATGAVTEAKLTFAAGSTSKNASTTTHGLLPILSGSSTQYLDGSGAWSSPLAPSPDNVALYTEDFITDMITGALSGVGPLTAGTSGAGAAFSYIASVANHWGIARLTTGSTSTGRGGALAHNSAVFLSTNDAVYEASFRVSQVGTAGTQTSTVRLGWMDNFITDPANGMYFKIDLDGTPEFFMTRIAGAGVEASSGTGVTLTANTWYHLKIEYRAATNQCHYYIDGVSEGVLTVTFSVDTGFGYQIEKTIGTTGHIIDVDYFHSRMTLPGGR